MNNEQFQMLIDLMGNAADGTFWLVVMFMSVEVLEVLLLTWFGLYMLYAGYKLIHTINVDPNEKNLKEIHKQLTGLDCYGSYCTMDHSAVVDKIAELKAKLKANKKTRS